MEPPNEPLPPPRPADLSSAASKLPPPAMPQPETMPPETEPTNTVPAETVPADTVPADTERTVAEPTGGRSKSAKPWVASLLVGVVLVLSIGVVSWVVFGRDGGEQSAQETVTTSADSTTDPVGEATSNTADGLPAAPEWRFELEFASQGSWISDPVFAGTADDLYVAEEPDKNSMIVSHYVGGELDWQSAPLEGNVFRLRVVDGQVILEFRGGGADIDLVHLDSADGSVVWTRSLAKLELGVQYGDRYFLRGPPFDDVVKVIELDPRTGAELNTIEAGFVDPVDDGFLLVDGSASTVQFVDLDLQPVGDAVGVEPNDNEYFPWVITRADAGWAYYSNSRLVVLSSTGDVTFDCTVSLEETRGVRMPDESTAVIWSLDAAEAFDVGQPGCGSSWRLGPVEYQLETDGPYIIAYHDDFSTNEPLDPVDLVDWQSGETEAIGQGQVVLTDDGRMVSLDGVDVVAKDVTTGDELWRIDNHRASRFEVVGDMVIVVFYGDEKTAGFNIYSDEP